MMFYNVKKGKEAIFMSTLFCNLIKKSLCTNLISCSCLLVAQKQMSTCSLLGSCNKFLLIRSMTTGLYGLTNHIVDPYLFRPSEPNSKIRQNCAIVTVGNLWSIYLITCKNSLHQAQLPARDYGTYLNSLSSRSYSKHKTSNIMSTRSSNKSVLIQCMSVKASSANWPAIN